MRTATVTAIDADGKEFIVLSESPYTLAKERCVEFISKPTKGCIGVWLRPSDAKPKWWDISQPNTSKAATK